jgi:hypothetical protein
MHLRISTVVAYICLMFPIGCYAAGFTDTWTLDVRSPTERKQGIECGIASFSLKQTGNNIVGDHTFYAPGCGLINEGGEGTVMGMVAGNTANLVVTSGRNGAVVRGQVALEGHLLHWVTLEELKAREPEGDSPLILDKGTLILESGH